VCNRQNGRVSTLLHCNFIGKSVACCMWETVDTCTPYQCTGYYAGSQHLFNMCLVRIADLWRIFTELPAAYVIYTCAQHFDFHQRKNIIEGHQIVIRSAKMSKFHLILLIHISGDLLYALIFTYLFILNCAYCNWLDCRCL